MLYSVQQQVHFNGNVFGNKCCRCIEGSLYFAPRLGAIFFLLEGLFSETWKIFDDFLKEYPYLLRSVGLQGSAIRVNTCSKAREQSCPKQPFHYESGPGCSKRR